MGQREQDAELIYSTTDPQRFVELLDTYQVRYIYVGQLEQALYAPAALAKFGALVESGLLQKAYANPKVTIYRVL